ncbi:MAG: ribonuclease P protein component [Proteobacteria bacterium]|nr:ribonuclease P protein component [Pseudomonadota bacterium]
MGIETGRFRRSDRLVDSRDFRRILRRGRRRADEFIVVISSHIDKNTRDSNNLCGIDASCARLGITASRKVGGAVVRNRFKRRVRAWFRVRRSEFATNEDIVVIARRPGAQLTFGQLDQHLSRLMDLESAESRAK